MASTASPSLLTSAYNAAYFSLSNAVTSPAANAAAAQRAADADAAASDAADAQAASAAQAQAASAAQAQSAADAAAASRASFSSARLAGNAAATAVTVLLVITWLSLIVLGASVASNALIYKPWPFRVWAAVYGALLWFIVLPYQLGYRWWWHGYKPRFYALIPLIPYHLDNRWARLALSWLSYKPDDEVAAAAGYPL